MRRLPLTLGAGSLLLIFTGTAFTADRATRDALWEAAKECERTVKDIVVKDIDQFGRVWFEYGRAGPFAQEQFIKCFQERVRATTQAVPLAAPGRVSLAPGAPAETSIPLEVAETVMLVQVEINGAPPAFFVLDTGASFTVLNPAYTRRFRISVPPSAKKIELTVVGGGTVSAPLVRVQSVKVGALGVQDVDVAIHDVFPEAPEVAGLLGADFLKHFRFTVDRQARRLTLTVPSAPGGPALGAPSSPVPTSCPPGAVWTGKGCLAEEATKGRPPPASKPEVPPPQPREPVRAGIAPVLVPTWERGYEWRFRWASPSGSGTFVRTIVGEEILGGLPHYVMQAGTRDILYTKADLAWLLDRVKGAVETRATPAYRGFAWPLEPGKEWEARYRWEHPGDRQTEDRVRRHKVQAQETIAVPAGSFQTLHVVVKDPAGKVVSEYWYAPAAKWFVKDRAYLSSGVRERELVEYRVSPARTPTPSRPAR